MKTQILLAFSWNRSNEYLSYGEKDIKQFNKHCSLEDINWYVVFCSISQMNSRSIFHFAWIKCRRSVHLNCLWMWFHWPFKESTWNGTGEVFDPKTKPFSSSAVAPNRIIVFITSVKMFVQKCKSKCVDSVELIFVRNNFLEHC